MTRWCLAIAALALVTFGSSQIPSRGQTGKSRQAEAESTKRPDALNQQGTEASPFFIKLIPTPKTLAEAAQDAKDREEKTANDRKLVEFTRKLVIATGILAAIGFLQLAVFGYQAYQLRETVQAATDQSKAMERSIAEANRLASAMENAAKDIAVSARAATDSVAAVKERTAQQMRAYLSVIVGSGVYQEREKNFKFQGKPLLVNTGNTPAHKVTFRASAAILPVPLPDDFAFPLPAAGIGGPVIGPHQNYTITPVVQDFCDDADVESIKRGDGKALCAWGIVTYTDVFEQPQETQFCQIITWLPDGKVWVYYPPRHNDAT
jgi:hypothetical protein